MKNTYIMDIDGTIADATHRMWAIDRTNGKKPQWDKFFELMKYDQPIKHMHELCWNLFGSSCLITYCSGRPERYRNLTINWLVKHGFPVESNLYMRSNGDYRPDHVIKEELLEQIRLDGYHPIMAFDDRDQVVRMWRKNGIPCAQVAEGDF